MNFILFKYMMGKEYKYGILFTFSLIIIGLFFNFFIAFKTIKVINHYESVKNENLDFNKIYTGYMFGDIIVDNCQSDIYILNNTGLDYLYGKYIGNIGSGTIGEKKNNHCLYHSNITLTGDNLINFCEKQTILIPECYNFQTVFDYDVEKYN